MTSDHLVDSLFRVYRLTCQQKSRKQMHNTFCQLSVIRASVSYTIITTSWRVYIFFSNRKYRFMIMEDATTMSGKYDFCIDKRRAQHYMVVRLAKRRLKLVSFTAGSTSRLSSVTWSNISKIIALAYRCTHSPNKRAWDKDRRARQWTAIK